ncbi:MAG: hypothetical protein ACFFEY_01150 [Candidatus Thorarchaeota archaeon]
MSNENNIENLEKEKKDTKPFLKGWETFIEGVKEGFDDFKASLENQSKKNKELWEENKEKINKFFTNAKEDWESKVNKWNTEIQRRRLESKEQWDNYKNKVSQDFNDWQEKTRNDWNKGLKTFRRGFLRAYLWFLLLITPIIAIIVILIILLR